MMADLEEAIASQKLNKQSFSAEGKTYVVSKVDNFEYVDPVDKSVASKQVRHWIYSCISVIYLSLFLENSENEYLTQV